jgi:hypothetical protein
VSDGVKIFMVDYTINDDGREYALMFFLACFSAEQASKEAEEIAKRENSGGFRDNGDDENDFPYEQYLEDHTTQSMSIDRVRELTPQQEKSLTELGILWE